MSKVLLALAIVLFGGLSNAARADFLAACERHVADPKGSREKVAAAILKKLGTEDCAIAKSRLGEIDTLYLQSGYVSPDEILFLQELTALRKLTFYRTNIGGVKELSQLARLTDLAFDNCGFFSDVAPLANLKNLKKLDLRFSYRSPEDIGIPSPESMGRDPLDIGSLTKLPLNYLNLSGTYVESWEPIIQFKDLEEIWIAGQKLESLKLIEGLTKLKRLGASRNSLTDISALAKLPELEELTLHTNAISDISVIKNNPRLVHINVSRNPVADIRVLENLEEVTEVNFSSTLIESIQPLVKFKDQLTFAYLGSVPKVKDFSLLREFKSLETLWLQGNELASVDFLAGLTKLKSLYLGDNKLTSVESLSGLNALSELTLYGNPGLPAVCPVKEAKPGSVCKFTAAD